MKYLKLLQSESDPGSGLLDNVRAPLRIVRQRISTFGSNAQQTDVPPSIPCLLDPPCSPRVSMIIPVLNEATLIAPFLRHLRERAPEAELIVVDGGSTDETRVLASCSV